MAEDSPALEELTVTQALDRVRASLGLDASRPKELLEAARDKLELPPPEARTSFKHQLAVVCDACDVQTHWPASPRPGQGAADGAQAAPPVFKKLTVSISWLKKFVDTHGDALEGKSTDEVVRTLLTPQTAERQCSVAETLVGQRLRPELIDDAAMCVGEATCLVSHAWSDTFVDTVGAVVAWGQTRPQPDAEFAWLDAFAVSQHGSPLTEGDGWDSLYRTAVGEIGNTVIVLTPWDKPSVLSQLWCAWDFLCAVDSGAELTFQLPAGEQTRLSAALETDVDAMRQLVRNVEGDQSQFHAAAAAAMPGESSSGAEPDPQPEPLSVSRAQAQTESERERLSGAITRLIQSQQEATQASGSSWEDAADSTIRRRLREWCLRETLAHCRRRQAAGDSSEPSWRYLHELGVHTAECDDSDVATLLKAEELLTEALAARQAEYGTEHASTLESMEALKNLRARLPVEEGEPPAGAYITVEGLPAEGSVQQYEITWRNDTGAVQQSRHRYSEFDTLRNRLLKSTVASLSAEVRKLPFPAKKWVHGNDLVSERASELTEFLSALVVTERLITPSENGSTTESVELYGFMRQQQLAQNTGSE